MLRHTAFSLCLIVLAAMPACAQVPIGGAPTTGAPEAPALPVVPGTANTVTAEQDDADFRAQLEVDQEERQKEREAELQDGGLKWAPWSQAGAKLQQFALERVPSLKEDPYMQPPENGGRYDFAVADIDLDNLPDVVLYRWGGCGTVGCAFTVVYNNKGRTPDTYYGHKLRPYQKGVLLDDEAYYGF